MNKATILTAAFAATVAVPVAIVSLRGSHASMVRQNKIADRQGLTRIRDGRQLARFQRAGLLKRLPAGKTVKVDHRLKPEFRWTRPWTRRYLVELGQDHYRHFHRRLQVNSAVRTVAYQHKLIRTNPNAARGATHLTQSSHPTGATVDITKVGMSRPELKWMRIRLLHDERVGRIEATEEHQQRVFHLMVIR